MLSAQLFIGIIETDIFYLRPYLPAVNILKRLYECYNLFGVLTIVDNVNFVKAGK